jgi:hypothetical protein
VRKEKSVELVMSSLTLPRWFGRIRKKKKKIPSNDSDETDSKGIPFQGHGLQNSRSLPATPRKDSTVVVLQTANAKKLFFLLHQLSMMIK